MSLEIPLWDISWYVKCHLRFPFRIFHDTWSVTWDSPFGYFMVREVSLEIPLSDIPWYVKCHSRFPSRVFHGTRSVIWDSPIGYFTVRELHSGFPYRMLHKTKGSLIKFLKRGKASCLLKRYSSCDAFSLNFLRTNNQCGTWTCFICYSRYM